MSYIYLASPYTHKNEAIMQDRYTAALMAVAMLTRAEITAYSPITYYHPLAINFDMPRDFDFWQRHNLNMLRHSNLLMVLTLEGWRESKGVNWEIEYAQYSNLLIKEVSLTGLQNGTDLL